MAANRLPLLVVAAAGLGALLWWDMQPEAGMPDDVIGSAHLADGREWDEQDASTPMPAPGWETVDPLASPDKESLRDMTERPLFARSRRPPPPPREAEPAFVPPAPPSTPDYTLVGIIRDGERAIALLRGRSNGRNLRVKAGDEIDGWEIADVGTVSVRLNGRDGAPHVLRVAPR